MRHRHALCAIRHVLTTFTTIVMLITIITTANANRLVVSNQQVRVVWEKLEFGIPPIEGTMRCLLTLEGSFHERTITKIRGLLAGYVTRAAVGNSVCTGGQMTILSELLPWHIRYESFSGTLPNIAGLTISLIRMGFIITFGGNNCRVVSTVASPFRLIASIGGGAIAGLRIDESTFIPFSNGPGGTLCTLASGAFRGTSRPVTLLGTTNTVSVTLI